MLGSQLKPSPRLAGAQRGAFFGGPLRRLSQSVSTQQQQQQRRPALQVQASGRVCELTGKKANNGYRVTFSHKRNKRLQHVNLHSRSIYWPEGKRFVKLRLSTQAIRTLEKKSLHAMAKEVGLDLYSLPYTDVSPGRTAWLAEHHKGNPAQPKKRVGSSRRMKNPAKLAASKKKPLQARYYVAGKVILTRDPRYVEEYRP